MKPESLARVRVSDGAAWAGVARSTASRRPMSATATPTRTTMRAVVLVDVARIELRDVPAPAPNAARGARARRGGGTVRDGSAHRRRPRELQPRRERPRPPARRGSRRSSGTRSRASSRTSGRDVADVSRRRPRDRRPGTHLRRASIARRSASTARRATRISASTTREHGITGLPGGFAEYVTVPAVNAVRVDIGAASPSTRRWPNRSGASCTPAR